MSGQQYDVIQVDAFTTTPLTGNACAVLPDASGLSEETIYSRFFRSVNREEAKEILAFDPGSPGLAFIYPISAAKCSRIVSCLLP